MSWVTVGPAAELVDDEPFAADVTVDGDDLAVVIVKQGDKLYALENECSHGKVELSEGEVMGDTIECYLHGAAFELATGKPTCLPATTPVRVFPVRIEGDDIQIDPDTTTQDY